MVFSFHFCLSMDVFVLKCLTSILISPDLFNFSLTDNYQTKYSSKTIQIIARWKSQLPDSIKSTKICTLNRVACKTKHFAVYCGTGRFWFCSYTSNIIHYFMGWQELVGPKPNIFTVYVFHRSRWLVQMYLNLLPNGTLLQSVLEW